ncbi:MAG: sulfurtransferase TusA family protein [Nitrospirota bacterium]|jgi:tRNA 2-thiouridine synthesizing protein A
MVEINADSVIDCRGMNCPMPVLKVKKAVDDLQVGQILRLEATDPGTKADIPAWAKRTGNEVLSMAEEGGIFIYYVKKMK